MKEKVSAQIMIVQKQLLNQRIKPNNYATAGKERTRQKSCRLEEIKVKTG